MRNCRRLGTDLIIPDIGILPSTDILAIDWASIDLVFRMTYAENPDLVERIEPHRGLRQLSYMQGAENGKSQLRTDFHRRLESGP